MSVAMHVAASSRENSTFFAASVSADIRVMELLSAFATFRRS
jgi:hypothetical protein